MVINLEESFQHLSRAPIVEAVIDIGAISSVGWDEEKTREFLKKLHPQYTKIEQQIRSGFKVTLGTETKIESTVNNLGCIGLRIWSIDKKCIAQFNQDGFVFSRLHPYENWENFSKEALRLWKVYIEIAKPTSIQRTSVRFINNIEVPPAGRLEDFLLKPPSPPKGLDIPHTGFMYQDVLSIPETSYVIALIRTIQSQKTLEAMKTGLIIDINVSSNMPFDYDEIILSRRLTEMRWLKNKVFFGSITRNDVEALK